MTHFTDRSLDGEESRNRAIVETYLAKFEFPTIPQVPFELPNMSFGEMGMRGISNVWLRRDGGEAGIWEARMTFMIFGTTNKCPHEDQPFHEDCHENYVLGRATTPFGAIMSMYHDAKSIGASIWD